MERLLALIRAFEGLRLKAYQCPAGVWTIGYGATGKEIVPGLIWTKKQAEADLARRAATILGSTARLCPLARGGALVALADFAYNLGPTRLKASTLRRKVNAGDWTGAAREIRRWVYAGGRRLPGLVLRREAEARLLLDET